MVDLRDRLLGKRVGPLLIGVVERDQRQLGEAESLDVRRARPAATRPLLEQRLGGLELTDELQGGALDQAAEDRQGLSPGSSS